MFKKGEYIVLIDQPINMDGDKLGWDSKSFKQNHIYKQKEDHKYLMTELDSDGSYNNGWSCYDFKYKNWRYATPQEITEYKRLGKPFDVSEIPNSNNYEIY
jgi:hypothetical protein